MYAVLCGTGGQQSTSGFFSVRGVLLVGIVLSGVSLAGLLWPLSARAGPGPPQTGTIPTDADRKWEVEVHGGGMLVNAPGGGTFGSLPPPGAGFTNLSGSPSRFVSSWYLGDGALLLNEVAEAVGFVERITPLDTAAFAGAAPQNGGTYGFRFGRVITRRLTAELTVDFTSSDLEFSGAARDSIEASRTTFVSTMWAVLPPPVLVQDLSVTDLSSFSDPGTQILTTGVVNFSLRSQGRILPYVTGGAGVQSQTGNTARLQGNYQFRVPNNLVNGDVNETDTVDIRSERSGLVGVAGGGIRYHLSSRWGLRGDVRFYLGGSTDTRLDLAPRVVTFGPNGVIVSTSTTPGIQFSNVSSPSNQRSNLSGPRVSDLRIYSGSGTQSQVNVTLGVFWRF